MNFANIFAAVNAAVVGLIAVLVIIAPLTKSTADNKVLDVLRFIEGAIGRFLFPSLVKEADLLAPAPKDEPPQAPPKI